MDKITDTMIPTIKDHHLVLLCTAKKLLSGTLGNTFYHHFEGLAYITGITFDPSYSGTATFNYFIPPH